ncbi:MAG: RlmE family RNA methyltransferase [Gammaproteobacteria bacterium]|nr:RlmE family RNA methyltransferase [Gammaproteobacteria bacterium]
MVRRKRGSSSAWVAEHERDPFVRRARDEGLRSRAAYKLAEIDRRDRLIRPGMQVVDLGAAPGGWSQYVATRMKGKGRILAVDLLAMAPICGVECIQGDFTDSEVIDRIANELPKRQVDLVLSDMAPNISGVVAVDQARASALCELALQFAQRVLRPEGTVLLKVFQGDGFDDLRSQMTAQFSRVVTRKPQASRARSKEMYLLATGYR